MRRSGTVARVLWAATLVACGRVGFDPDPVGVPHAMDFSVSCGAQPQVGRLEIANDGERELVITAANATNGFIVMSALPLTIAPGEIGSLDVAPPVAVIGTDRGGSIKRGTLVLDTNQVPAERSVELQASIVGANVDFFDPTNTPITTVAFANTSGNCPAPVDITVANTGNADIQIAFGATSGDMDASFTTTTLAGGSMATVSVWPVLSGACAGAGYVTFTITGDACTQTPAMLTSTVDITNSSTSCSCN